jgi:hypothetical protein
MSVEKLLTLRIPCRKHSILSHEIPFFCSQNLFKERNIFLKKPTLLQKNIISVEAAKVLGHVKEFLAS